MNARALQRVQLVSHSVFVSPEGDAGMPLMATDGASAGFGRIQSIPEFAGRTCYLSYDKPSEKTRTNAGYLANIQKQKHDSVLEHASVGFFLSGISRSCSHEMVRHRHFSYSQLSQRYVPVDMVKIVVPPKLVEWFDALYDRAADNDHPNAGISPVTGKSATREQSTADVTEAYAEEVRKGVVRECEAIEEMLIDMWPDLKKKPKLTREAARSELTNSVETRMVMTGNFRSWKNFLIQRDSPAADAEIRQLAQEIGRQLADIAPNVFGPEARALWDDGVKQKEARTTEA